MTVGADAFLPQGSPHSTQGCPRHSRRVEGVRDHTWLSSSGQGGGSWLQVADEQERMAIHAHNLDCSDLLKVRIFDESGRDDAKVLIAQEYMELLYSRSSVPQFVH